MVISHNIQAMNARRQLNTVSDKKAGSTAKLSSGYQINSAADDAAGLSISEKMRRQIRGLTQASANAQDGISFVQTADGALTEVHDMIQRGNQLAVQAANGTLTSEDREAINAEIVHLKEEINVIGERTKFNDIPIFTENGICASQAAKARKELAEKIANEYVPAAVSQLINKLNGSLGGQFAELAAHQSNADAYGIKLDITYIDGLSKTLADMTSTFDVKNPGYDEFIEGRLRMRVDRDDFPSVNTSPEQQQKLESTVAHELMHGLMDILLPEGMSGNADPADDPRNFPKWFKEGCAQLAGGGFAAGWNDGIAIIEKSSATEADKLSAIASYLKDGAFSIDGASYSAGGTFTVEGSPYGHGYLACAYLCQLASGQTNVSQGSLIGGANKIFNALMMNEQNYKNGASNVKSFEDVINEAIRGSGKNLSTVIGKIDNGSNDAAEFILDLARACDPGGSSFGAGSIIASSLSSADILDTTAASPQAMYITGYDASSSGESGKKEDNALLYLMVGSESIEGNKIALERFSLSTEALGIGNTNTLTAEDSSAAITQFKEALSAVSYMRSHFGALQNRLEHTIKNLDNVVENTTAAESLIRDTDIAKEMVAYSAQSILEQAGSAMVTQANQQSQRVLSLLQQ